MRTYSSQFTITTLGGKIMAENVTAGELLVATNNVQTNLTIQIESLSNRGESNRNLLSKEINDKYELLDGKIGNGFKDINKTLEEIKSGMHGFNTRLSVIENNTNTENKNKEKNKDRWFTILISVITVAVTAIVTALLT